MSIINATYIIKSGKQAYIRSSAEKAKPELVIVQIGMLYCNETHQLRQPNFVKFIGAGWDILIAWNINEFERATIQRGSPKELQRVISSEAYHEGMHSG